MMPNEVKRLAVITGQDGLEELGRACRVRGAEVLPTGVESSGIGVDQRWIIGVRDRVKVIDGQAPFGQAPCDGLLRQLPGRKGNRTLAVLATAESFLFRGRDGMP